MNTSSYFRICAWRRDRAWEKYRFLLNSSRGLPRAFLSVKALFEVKFNYAMQTGQTIADGGAFRSRLTEDAPATKPKRDAIKQPQSYKSQVTADSAYPLYLVAAPTIKVQPPPKPRDSGWAHYDHRDRRDNRETSGMDAAKGEIKKRLAMRNLGARGEHEIAAHSASNPRDSSFYCCLIEV
jgi:hypothetical protein